MKKYVLLIIAAILFLVAAGFSTWLLIDILSLPENPEDMSASIGKGLSIVVAVIFFAIAAIVHFVAMVLSLIGLIVTKRGGESGGVVALYAVGTILPIVAAILPFLLLPLN